MSRPETISAVLAALLLSAGFAGAQVRPGTWVSEASPPSLTQDGQSSPSSPAQAGQDGGGATPGPTQMRPLPKVFMHVLRLCQAMPHDTMTQTQMCQLLTKRFPQLVQGDGSLAAPPVAPP
jgi:hypothetical protein